MRVLYARTCALPAESALAQQGGTHGRTLSSEPSSAKVVSLWPFMRSMSQPKSIVVAVRKKMHQSVCTSTMPESIAICTRMIAADTARRSLCHCGSLRRGRAASAALIDRRCGTPSKHMRCGHERQRRARGGSGGRGAPEYSSQR